MVLFEFQESVKDALLPDLHNPPHPLARPAGHTVTKIARLKPNSNRTAQNKCCVCKKSTQYECLACPEHPGLCYIIGCFDNINLYL